MGFIKVKGHNLNYRFIYDEYLNPDNPFIIFLHEGLGSIPQWRKFPNDICENLKLPGFLYERYGYGQSDILKEKRNMDYLVYEGIEVFPELIEKLNITNKLILIGHSDGASIALAYASKYSNKICCLIAEAPHVFIEEISVQSIKNAIKMFEAGVLKKFLKKYHDNKTESMFYGWALTWTNKDYTDWNMEHVLPDIKCPVYVIQGENDEHGTERQVNLIVSKVSGPAKGLMIPDCAHIPHFQQKKLVMNEIMSFIKEYK